MRMVTLVMAHENALQVRALCARLLAGTDEDRVVVHLDARSALWQADRGAFLAGLDGVEVVERPVEVRWGHMSQVAAILRLLDAGLAGSGDLFHLISGADWPVAGRAEIAAQATPGGCFIEASCEVQSERMDQVRLDSRWLRPDPAHLLEWHTAHALRRASALLPKRSANPWGPWHKGSTWWSLPRDVAGIVLREASRAIATGRLIGTRCADEHLVQTIVAQAFESRIAPPKRFMRWDSGADSPKVLTAADWSASCASGAWFARKLSVAIDPFFLSR